MYTRESKFQQGLFQPIIKKFMLHELKGYLL